MVLSRPGGDNDPPSLVSQVLSDAAVVPAIVIEINHYQSRLRPRHCRLKNVVEKYKKHSLSVFGGNRQNIRNYLRTSNVTTKAKHAN